MHDRKLHANTFCLYSAKWMHLTLSDRNKLNTQKSGRKCKNISYQVVGVGQFELDEYSSLYCTSVTALALMYVCAKHWLTTLIDALCQCIFEYMSDIDTPILVIMRYLTLKVDLEPNFVFFKTNLFLIFSPFFRLLG